MTASIKTPPASLVSAQWLADRLNAPGMVVLDATKHLPGAERNARAEFAQRHIPGAQFFDLGQLVDDTSDVPMACPRPDQIASLLQESGVGAQDQIIFYDDSAIKSSARAWFLCRQNGFGNVAILDGGLSKWTAQGLPLSSGDIGAPSPAQSAASISTQGRIRTKADMLANIESRAEQVLDARDEGRFSGAIDDGVHGLPGGHIPGARNLPFTRLFRSDGTYKSADELAALFLEAGIALDQPVTTSCGSGMTASVLLFAMHLIGKDDTALYDGSWAEWGSDSATPKAKSAENRTD